MYLRLNLVLLFQCAPLEVTVGAKVAIRPLRLFSYEMVPLVVDAADHDDQINVAQTTHPAGRLPAQERLDLE